MDLTEEEIARIRQEYLSPGSTKFIDLSIETMKLSERILTEYPPESPTEAAISIKFITTLLGLVQGDPTPHAIAKLERAKKQLEDLIPLLPSQENDEA